MSVQNLNSANKMVPLVAFVHIEKAAGTTLIHILRTIYCGAYLDVRPLTKCSNGVFASRDLKAVRMIVPGLRCIAGHSIVPYSDLSDVNYITLLRDPVKRYLSHYQHWVERKGLQLTFEEFLDNEEMSNFQTKKIAGSDDVDKAKALLRNRFLLAGCVEEFDAFLVLLASLTSLPRRYFWYVEENKALNTVIKRPDYDKYREAICQNNACDIELYEYVRGVLLTGYIDRCGPGFRANLADFVAQKALPRARTSMRLGDYVLRKAYLEPVTGAIRLLHGLPYRGSY